VSPGIAGSIGGGVPQVDPEIRTRIHSLLFVLGLDVGALTRICDKGGFGHEIHFFEETRPICCTFSDGHEVWSETVECPLLSAARDCCEEEADGWFRDDHVVASRNGACR